MYTEKQNCVCVCVYMCVCVCVCMCVCVCVYIHTHTHITTTQMMHNGQLHAPATFSAGRESLLSFIGGILWAPGSVGAQRKIGNP